MNTCDILILGSGIAGLSYAIKIAEKRSDLKIVLLTKDEISTTNTELAQGGIAAVTNLNCDSFDSHIQDTIEAGGGLSNYNVVKHVIETAPERINELMKYGVEFSKDSFGKLELGLEGGHRANRIVHVKDQTGKEIEEVLSKKVKSFNTISIYTHFIAIDLIQDFETIVGVMGLDFKKQIVTKFYSKITVLATGGSGQVYKYTTNPKVATGDGVAMAFRIGAKISNMNYCQFHPTALKEIDKNPLFLISEAVRGFGAHVVNGKGERFIFKSDGRGELATRDIVSKAIIDELKSSDKENVFLDCRHLNKNNFKKHFPFIVNYCESKGFDLGKNILPIIPAAHYQCGGIEVAENGKTSKNNLYAIGECSNTGLHGKNRLASNSLLEALVFAHEAAIESMKTIDSIELKYNEPYFENYFFENEGNDDRFFIQKIQEIMSENCVIGAEKSQVVLAITELDRLKKAFFNSCKLNTISLDYIETKNLFDVAQLISSAMS